MAAFDLEDGLMIIKATWLDHLDSPTKMGRRQGQVFWESICKEFCREHISAYHKVADVCDPENSGYFQWKAFSPVIKKYFPHLRSCKSESEEHVKERARVYSKKLGKSYDSLDHLLFSCALGDLTMVEFLVEKKKIDPQASRGKRSSRFKDSDTALTIAKRYENRNIRKYLESRTKRRKTKKKEKSLKSSDLSDLSKDLSKDGGVDHSYLIPASDLEFGDKKPVGEEGGTATVFRAKYVGTNVAVKVLKRGLTATATETFAKEISVMSKLHHPNIVLLMGACIDSQNLMIVMEMMEGGSVWSQLRNKQGLPPYRLRMNWAVDTCRGMSYLHREDNQILHLDLKSPNILLDSSLKVKVADFGLSEVKKLQAVPVAVGEESGTKKGQEDGPMLIEGSIPWMAPECFRDEEYTDRADVYSFGVIMWELVTGQVPWTQFTQWAITYQVGVAGKRLEIPPEAPPTAKKIMELCYLDPPPKRPSFSEILPMAERLPVEVSVADPVGCQFWFSSFPEDAEVPYDNFLKRFLIYFNLNDPANPVDVWTRPNFEAALALKAALSWSSDTMKQVQESTFFTAPAQVNVNQFGTFLTFFGPLKKDQVSNFNTRVLSVMKQKFFHGDIDTPEAIRRLSQHPEGTYLVRFSTRSPGTYTLSVRSSAAEISHFRLPGTGGEACDSMSSFLASQKNLNTPCPGSKYQPIFSAYAFKEIIQSSAYLATME